MPISKRLREAFDNSSTTQFRIFYFDFEWSLQRNKHNEIIKTLLALCRCCLWSSTIKRDRHWLFIATQSAKVCACVCVSVLASVCVCVCKWKQMVFMSSFCASTQEKSHFNDGMCVIGSMTGQMTCPMGRPNRNRYWICCKILPDSPKFPGIIPWNVETDVVSPTDSNVTTNRTLVKHHIQNWIRT